MVMVKVFQLFVVEKTAAMGVDSTNVLASGVQMSRIVSVQVAAKGTERVKVLLKTLPAVLCRLDLCHARLHQQEIHVKTSSIKTLDR